MPVLSPCARSAVTPMCRVIFLFSHEMLSLVGGACSQTRCLPPVHLLVLQWPQTTRFSLYPASVTFLLMDGIGDHFSCMHQPILKAAAKLVFVLIFLFPQHESLWSGSNRARGVSKLCGNCSCWLSQVSWYLSWGDVGGIEVVSANSFVLRKVS